MNNIKHWFDNFDAVIRSNRLSKRKNWRIKKFIRVNGNVYYKCYYRSPLRYWIVYEDSFTRLPKIFNTEGRVIEFIESEMKNNKTKHLYLKGDKISKVEVVRTKQESRQRNINKIL